MPKLLRTFALFFLVMPGLAFAQDALTEDEVDRFMTSLEELNNIDERYPDVEFDLGMDQNSMGNPATMQQAFERLISPDGKLIIFTSVVSAIDQNPEAAQELRQVMRRNGFDDREEFASVGNRLMLAIAASEMDPASLAQMQQMAQLPPDQMQYMPPAIREIMPASPLSDGRCRMCRKATCASARPRSRGWMRSTTSGTETSVRSSAVGAPLRFLSFFDNFCLHTLRCSPHLPLTGARRR